LSTARAESEGIDDIESIDNSSVSLDEVYFIKALISLVDFYRIKLIFLMLVLPFVSTTKYQTKMNPNKLNTARDKK
jgi:hypothetical protein